MDMNVEEASHQKLPFFVRHNILVVILIALAVSILYGGYRTYDFFAHRNDYQLQSAEVSSLINFLKAHNLQAAVVQKIYAPNNGSTWLVKSDGQTIFLYSKDLGTYEDLTTLPYIDQALGSGAADKAYLLPGDAQVYDKNLDRYWDISSDVVGYITNSAEEGEFARYPAVGSGDPAGNVLSPNGEYSINYADQLQNNTDTIQLNKIGLDGTPVPLLQFPGTNSLLSWSTDSNYILMIHDPRYPNEGLDIYDIHDATTTHVNTTIDSAARFAGGNGSMFATFIYPSTILFSKFQFNNAQIGGVFSIDLTDANQTEMMILPNEIKMVGLIP
jgi:hypothetical protein